MRTLGSADKKEAGHDEVGYRHQQPVDDRGAVSPSVFVSGVRAHGLRVMHDLA
jgi:hypothetical protein